MWIFCVFGCYSVVVDPQDRHQVIVRSRYHDDIVKLSQVFGLPLELTPLRDYPYRIGIKKCDWSMFLFEQAEGIDYVNFKEVIMQRQGVERHDDYLGVWSLLAMLSKKSENTMRLNKMESEFDHPMHQDLFS